MSEPRYVEIQVTSHFSFLRGASSADELFAQAALLGIDVDRTISITFVMGAALAARVTDFVTDRKDDITAAVMSLGDKAQYWADQLQSGSLPKVSAMPEALRVVFEDIYGSGISHSFLIAVPFAVISLIAIVFLPNKSLTTMTTTERMQASEADLATVSVPEAMGTLTATGSVRTMSGADAGARADDADAR